MSPVVKCCTVSAKCGQCLVISCMKSWLSLIGVSQSDFCLEYWVPNVLVDLGWVGLDFDCSNALSACAWADGNSAAWQVVMNGGTSSTKATPTQMHEQMGHHADFSPLKRDNHA